MADLEGDDAFTMVLDRLLDAEYNVRSNMIALDEQRSIVAECRREIQKLTDRNRAAQERLEWFVTGERKLNALHSAVVEMLAAPPEKMSNHCPKVQAALAEAAEYCDVIPF